MLRAVFLCLLGSVLATPLGKNPRVVHEKRAAQGSLEWKTRRVDRSSIVPVRIGLVQSNLDTAYERVMEVAHPSSGRYGQHWSFEDVAAHFAPSSESDRLVREWLADAGFSNVGPTSAKGWISFEAAVEQVEDLLDAKYMEFKHSTDGTVRLGCNEYSLPDHLAAHIDYISPGVKLSPPTRKTVHRRDAPLWHFGNSTYQPSQPSWQPPYTGPWRPPPGSENLPPELQSCSMNITPPCIRSLYSIPSPQGEVASGALGIYEARGFAYSQDDLNEYFAKYAPYVPQGTHPFGVSINNGTVSTSQNSTLATGEPDIDLDMAYAILGPANITYYAAYFPSTSAAGSNMTQIFGPLLDAIDGSFCTEDERAKGYECGTTSLSTVLSISYGLSEYGTSAAAVARVCNEFMKLALQGHTIVVSSGDYGVAASPGLCTANQCLTSNITQNLATMGRGSGTIFNPSFPASCPYVLAVGGTQIEPNKTVLDPESVMYQPKIGFCRNDTTKAFSSGGGFSNLFPRSDFQQSAVERYFAQHDPGYPYYSYQSAADLGANGGVYNRVGRAIPDIAANGANFTTFIRGRNLLEYGTSLSAPLVASIITLLNQERLEAGKSPVGFVNPVFYEHPYIFHDITLGHSAGCNTENGFSAVPGWDPVTGLGTPNYPAMSRLFKSLP